MKGSQFKRFLEILVKCIILAPKLRNCLLNLMQFLSLKEVWNPLMKNSNGTPVVWSLSVFSPATRFELLKKKIPTLCHDFISCYQLKMQSALSDHFYSIYVHKYAFYKGFFLNCMENNRWVDTKSKVWRVGKWCVECQCEMEKRIWLLHDQNSIWCEANFLI